MVLNHILNNCPSRIVEIINFDEICRICWGTDNLKSVFNADIPSLCEMLMACSPLEVCEENGLPTKLCTNCSHELELAFAFRSKCINSDLKLKKYLEDNGIETTIQYTHDPITEETIETIHTTVAVKDNSVLQYDDDLHDVILKEKQLTVGNTIFSINNADDDKNTIEPINLNVSTELQNDEVILNSEPVSNYEIVETNTVPSVIENDNNVEQSKLVEADSIHLKENSKRYSCNLCEKSYLHPRNLRRHISEFHSGKLKQTKSGSRTFRCSICRRIFSFKNALIRHLRFIHREITSKCFKFVNGKKCCTGEINLFIENTNENTREVKGILADIENAPSPHSDNDDVNDNKLSYNFEIDDKIKIENIVEDSPNNQKDLLSSDIKAELEPVMNIAENEHAINCNNEILIEDILKNNDGNIQMIQEENHTILVVDEQLFNKIAQIETATSPIENKVTALPASPSPTQPYQCNLCNQKFSLRFGLKRHLKLMHNIIEFLKQNPDIEFSNTQTSEIFNELKTEIKALGNEIDINVADEKNDDNPIDSCDTKVKYPCKLCDKSYYAKTNLHRHIKDKHLPKMKEQEKLYKCDMCDRAFIRKGLLERHKDSHFERVAFQCEQCGDVFDKKTKLRQHVVKHETQKKFQCDICQKWFLRATTLRVHKKQHASILPYPCPECDRAFSMRPALEAHVRTHSESRPYVCDICRRAFRHPGHLETHKKLHTGERPYSCTMCSKKFTTSTHLKYHIKVHLDQRDFKCEVCGRAFIHSSELKYHMISHTQIKERPCPICGKLFARTNQVTKHLRQVHKLRKNYYAC